MAKAGFLLYHLAISIVLLPEFIQGQTFNVSMEEGMKVITKCDSANVLWNATIAGNVYTVATCYENNCVLYYPYVYDRSYLTYFNVGLYNKSSSDYPARKSYLAIERINTWVTKVQCNRLSNVILRTWLMNVVVRPEMPVCSAATLESRLDEMAYVLTITCTTVVFPRAICTLELKGLMDIYSREITYSHKLSELTNRYTTKCVHRLHVYSAVWPPMISSESYYRVTAYPDSSIGLNFTATTPWMNMFPQDTAQAGGILSFTINDESYNRTVACGEMVLVDCQGYGSPGWDLKLYDRESGDLLYSAVLPETITYHLNSPACGTKYTFGCRLGSEEQVLQVTVAQSPSSGTDKNNYVLAVAITLAIAILLTAIVVFFCIRMRLKRKRAAAGRGRRPPMVFHQPGVEHDETLASAPPAYHEIFYIDAPGGGLPDYWSLPPPYTATAEQSTANSLPKPITNAEAENIYETITSPAGTSSQEESSNATAATTAGSEV